MTDNIQHLDLESDEYYDAPKALRQYAANLKKALDSAHSERDTYRSQLNSRALGEVLSSKGFKNPKRVEKDLLADGVDPLDESAVSGWLAEFGDDYATGAAAPAQETPAVSDDERLAHEQLRVGSEFRSPADMSKLEAVNAEAPKDATGQDLIELYRKHGM